MIADSMENLDVYRGLSPRLDKAFDFMKETIIKGREDGRIDIDGDDVYALIQSYETAGPEEKPYEAHIKYIDIQYIVAGREYLYWAPISRLSTVMEYDETKDASYVDGDGGIPLGLSDGFFTVLFPQDAHKPGRVWDNAEMVKKVVIKIRL